MLSYYLFTGLVTGGAMLGVGLIGRSLPASSGSDVKVRSLTVLLAAFATGLGIIAAVIGLLAVLVDTSADSGGITAALAVLVPTAILGLPGLWLCRPGERAGVREVTAILLMFAALLGLGALATAALAVLLATNEGSSEFDPLVAILGLAAAAAPVGIGLVGARAVAQLTAAQPEPVDAGAVRSQAVLLAAACEAVGVLILTAVMAFLFIG